MVAVGHQISAEDNAIRDFCARWKVTELAVFGSVLRSDFRADSDLDLLIDFAPGARHTIFDVIRMEDELTSLFGRQVDLIEKRAIERSDNPIRRQAIIGAARVIFHLG